MLRREGNRTRKRELFSSDVVVTKVSADLTGSSGCTKAFRIIPPWSKVGGPLCHPTLTSQWACYCQLQQLSLAACNSQRASELRARRSASVPRPWGNGCLSPTGEQGPGEGIWVVDHSTVGWRDADIFKFLCYQTAYLEVSINSHCH